MVGSDRRDRRVLSVNVHPGSLEKLRIDDTSVAASEPVRGALASLLSASNEHEEQVTFGGVSLRLRIGANPSTTRSVSRVRAKPVQQSVELGVADQSVEKLTQRIAAGLADLPGDFAERRDALRELHLATRTAVAVAFEAVLNDEARARPQQAYDDKKALATWVNAELRELGLAIRCPRTDRPCRLMGNPGGKPGEGRFVLEFLDDAGRRQQPLTSVTLPHLALMPDDLRRASYADRHRPARGR